MLSKKSQYSFIHAGAQKVHKVMGLDAMVLVFLIFSFKLALFTLLLHPHQEALQFLFTFCH